MLRTLPSRILLASLLPLTVALLALGLFLALRFEAYHLNRMHDDLAYESELTARLLASDLAANRAASVRAAVADLGGARPEAHLVVVDARGGIVAASPRWDPDDPGTEPALGELRLALTGQNVSHPGNDFGPEGLFVALPVRHEGRIVGALHLAYDVGHVTALIRELRLTVLVAVMTAGALAALVALVIARSVTRPVAALARAANHLAEGHLEERVASPPTVELGTLASTFNHLAARLQELEKARRELLADISHDLRAPVGAIQAATETLLAGAGEEAALRERLLLGIGHEMQRLARLTGDLLALARFEAGRLELHSQPMSLGQLASEVVASFETEAHARGIELRLEASVDLPILSLDPDRIAQVLTNLLTNALKFTPSGGRVVLRSTATADQVVLAVSDTGPGIPPEDLARLFDRFYQASDEPTRKAGLGLGLAIVKALVEAHGGQVAVDSRPGVGTTFTLRLPRDTAVRKHDAEPHVAIEPGGSGR